MSTFAFWILLVSLVHPTFQARPIRYVARRYIYTASICNLLDVRGSRTLVLILRNQRNRLCAMFSVFVDADDNGRGPISCHAAGTEIQRECNSEAHYIALAIVWVVCIVSGLCFDANYRLTFLAQLHTDAVQSGNLNRLVHNDFPRSQSSSGSISRSCSTTVEQNKCTEHGAIQKGRVQCTVGAASVSCLL